MCDQFLEKGKNNAYHQHFSFTVGPTSVTILNKKDPVSAGKFVDVRCQTVGARPPPTITWWLAGKQVGN